MKFEIKIKYENQKINSTKIETSIQYAHKKWKQVNMVTKRKWNNKEKIGYKLDETFGIILPTHDVFFPF
jgi:hypothetical protein